MKKTVRHLLTFTVHYWPETEDEKLASALKTMWFRWKLQGMQWTLRLDHFVKTGVIINSRLQLYVPKRPCLLCVTTEQQLCALQHLPWKLVWWSDPAESWSGWHRDGRGVWGGECKNRKWHGPKKSKKNKHTFSLGFRFQSDFCDAFLHFFLQFYWPWCHFFLCVYFCLFPHITFPVVFFPSLSVSTDIKWAILHPEASMSPRCSPMSTEGERESEKMREGVTWWATYEENTRHWNLVHEQDSHLS